MRTVLYAWLASLVIILAIDFIWLSVMVPKFYKPYMGQFFTREFSYLTALSFYVIYAFGISYLIIFQGVNLNSSLLQVFVNGLVLGLVTYGAYDLTNQATMKDWPFIVTIVDIGWGAFLTGTTSAITYKIQQIL